jgi:hypothetical protein
MFLHPRATKTLKINRLPIPHRHAGDKPAATNFSKTHRKQSKKPATEPGTFHFYELNPFFGVPIFRKFLLTIS